MYICIYTYYIYKSFSGTLWWLLRELGGGATWSRDDWSRLKEAMS